MVEDGRSVFGKNEEETHDLFNSWDLHHHLLFISGISRRIKSLPIIWIELETSAKSKIHKLRYPILSHGFATTPMVAPKTWNRLNRLETSTPDGIFLGTPGTPGTHATCLLLSPKSMMYKWCLGDADLHSCASFYRLLWKCRSLGKSGNFVQWWIFQPRFFGQLS